MPYAHRLMRKRTAIALATLVGLVLPALAEEKPIELKWKFDKGKTLYQELTTETTQDLKVMGMDVKQKQTLTFNLAWTPIELKDNHWIIKQKFEDVKMEVWIAAVAAPGNNALVESFKALKGSEFKLTVGPDMLVTKVEGHKEFVDKFGTA